jgi:hypothetical protein
MSSNSVWTVGMTMGTPRTTLKRTDMHPRIHGDRWVPQAYIDGVEEVRGRCAASM